MKNNIRSLNPVPQKPFLIGERLYEVVPFCKNREDAVDGNTMLDRAKAAGVEAGKEDGEYMLEHRDEIPPALQQSYLVFPKWSDFVGYVVILGYNADGWGARSSLLMEKFPRNGYLLRRVYENTGPQAA